MKRGQATDVTCPVCGAPPGQGCTEPHVARAAAARRELGEDATTRAERAGLAVRDALMVGQRDPALALRVGQLIAEAVLYAEASRSSPEPADSAFVERAASELGLVIARSSPAPADDALLERTASKLERIIAGRREPRS